MSHRFDPSEPRGTDGRWIRAVGRLAADPSHTQADRNRLRGGANADYQNAYTSNDEFNKVQNALDELDMKYAGEVHRDFRLGAPILNKRAKAKRLLKRLDDASTRAVGALGDKLMQGMGNDELGLSNEDVDLTRYVRTPAGERYFHKPIGSPIGGGGRGSSRVSLKGFQTGGSTFNTPYMLKGQSYDGMTGEPLQKPVPSKATFTQASSPAEALAMMERRAQFGPGGPSAPKTVSLKPSPIKGEAVVPSEEGARYVAQRRGGASPRPTTTVERDIADLIKQYDPSQTSIADAAAWWKGHSGPSAQPSEEDLASDLGLNPKLSHHSIRELRKQIKDAKTPGETRKEMKEELARRVALAKETSAQAKSFTAKLTDKLSDKPEDADLAPVIGETLAAHPRLGPLAHLWDRARLAGYNFKKKVREGEFTDELPRILARSAFMVLMTFLMMHLGMAIPGLDFATASGD